ELQEAGRRLHCGPDGAARPPHGTRRRDHRRRQGHGRRKNGGAHVGGREGCEEPCRYGQGDQGSPLARVSSFTRDILFWLSLPGGAPQGNPLSSYVVRTLSMSPTDLAVQEQQAAGKHQRVVNDFSIQVATVNGSGSQTANLVLLRSILLMGVPVSGKNMFPSNIAGLP